MNVALVYDRVNKLGGAERILSALQEIYPDAPLYTGVYNPATAPWATKFKVIPTFLQSIPFAKSHHEYFPWLMPSAFEQFTFEHFDLVISITSGEAKSIISCPHTFHLCYCLTPPRYLWNLYNNYSREPGLPGLNSIAKLMFPIVATPMRQWDQILSTRPDAMVAISTVVARRIKKYYSINAPVIYPPVNCDFFTFKNGNKGKYFLVVSRLVPYKRIDLVIEVFNILGWPLIIIGNGRDDSRLKGMAKHNILFIHNLTDSELLSYYQNCTALVLAAEEDFGLVSLEAQSCGKPVIACTKGGLKETIIPGVTGELFSSQTKDSLIAVLRQFNIKRYNPYTCRRNALRFEKHRFKKNFANLVKTFMKKSDVLL